MPTLDQFHAFVTAVDEGSFSAAGRVLGKAQSAVSTAVNNLEIEAGVELFDRSRRSPTLTAAGEALLQHARSALRSSHEFVAHAMSLGEGGDTHLCVAIEQGIVFQPLLAMLEELSREFPYLEIELLEPGRNDVAALLRNGRADIGLMLQQEDYVQGVFFRGIGYSLLVPVCSRSHPLAKAEQVTNADLRSHRQLVTRSRSVQDTSHLREQKSSQLWYSESPYLIEHLVALGLGWAVLPHSVVRERLQRGDLVRMKYSFQQSDILQGVDVVWTEQRALGRTGQWLMGRLLNLKPEIWSG